MKSDSIKSWLRCCLATRSDTIGGGRTPAQPFLFLDSMAGCMLLMLLACLSLSCNSRSETSRQELRVFMADSLYLPFKKLSTEFEKLHSDITVTLIPSGSVLAARKIVDAKDRADIVAVADYLVIEKMLRPQYADWYACFATNEVVIAYTEASKHSAELKTDNWFEVLTREGVKVGAANPYQDPCGYWSELCWKLADLHYKGVPAPTIHERMTRRCGLPKDRHSDTEELLQLLESAAGIDYAFVYLSQARQHRLPCLRLPTEINLSDFQQAEAYHRVTIQLPGLGSEPGVIKRGEPIVYAMTIPKNAAQPALATTFIQFALSPSGRKLLTEQHLNAADAPWTLDPTQVPSGLKNDLAARTTPTSRPAPFSTSPSSAAHDRASSSGTHS